MDPKNVFFDQVEKFLIAFSEGRTWTIRKDTKNNIVILIPPEWLMHAQLNGISLQFALNVRGELVLSISIENPIVLESRVDFKGDLYTVMKDNKFLETIFKGFEPNFNRRGKFLRKILPMLSDSHTELIAFANNGKLLIPFVLPLIEKYKKAGKIVDPYAEELTDDEIGDETQCKSDSDDLSYDEGESNYEFQYSPARKIFTQKAEYSVEYLHKMCRRGKLNLQPDFQRQFV